MFRNGRILLSLLPETAPPEVVAQIGGADLVSAAALVEWGNRNDEEPDEVFHPGLA